MSSENQIERKTIRKPDAAPQSDAVPQSGASRQPGGSANAARRVPADAELYDVAVIGGGAVGATIARTLSAYRLRLVVFEKNPEVCQETSKANSAIVHAGYDCKPGTLKARLNVRGNALYPQLSRELDFTFRPIGSMVLAFSDEERESLSEIYAKGLANGVPGMELIDGARARAIEPGLSAQVTGALYARTAGVVDPFNYTWAMMENAVQNGAELLTETQVTGLSDAGDGICIRTDRGIFRARYVVNAAGLYADQVARMTGDGIFRILPTKGVYRLLDKQRAAAVRTVLFQVPTPAGKGILVTPTYDGNTMLGPTADPVGDPSETTTDAGSLSRIDAAALKSVPGLRLDQTIRVFTGVRAKPDTGDFMIFPSRHLPGVLHCGGIESPGLASAPAIGEYVVSCLTDMGLEAKPDPAFNPFRTGIPRLSQMSLSEKKAAIEQNPLYGHIICRCETVSEAEIVEAIRRPAGARTVDGVKRRVRAGMGRCQGGFCGPRVLEILSRELGVEPTAVRKELSGSEIVRSYLKKAGGGDADV